MLMLIGLGLEEKDISIKALHAAKSATKLYLDSYTAPVSDEYVTYLEKETGKKIQKLDRHALEENAKTLVEEATKETVAIMFVGDPLVATTHHTILDLSKKTGVDARVYHAPSIFSVAIGESGLDIYKFGPTTTLPFWSKNYKPISFIDAIIRNVENGEHTLVLVDVDSKNNATMHADEAISLLSKACNEKGVRLSRILLVGNAGCADQKIVYVEFSKAEKVAKDFSGKKISIIVPASLNFAEEETLKRFPNL